MTICVGLIPAFVVPHALRGDKGAAQVVALAFAAQLFTYFWLSRFRLEFSSDRIAYGSLFRHYRTIQRDSIVEADFATETSRFESQFTFVIRTEAGDGLRVNAKVFSREALQHLLALAPQRSNQSLQPTPSQFVSSRSHDKNTAGDSQPRPR